MSDLSEEWDEYQDTFAGQVERLSAVCELSVGKLNPASLKALVTEAIKAGIRECEELGLVDDA